ncbi:MAG: flavin reductase family protein [Anaerolineae bacterium]|nr:flavin reductase family protein [Anaerolineae bacterium]
MSTDPIKDALHRMPYGFYSITSRHGDEVNAMVANWVMQASFTPRLMVVGLQKKAYSHQVIGEGGVFAINIFRKEDQDAMMPFTKGRAKKPEKMADAVYTPAPETGCPILQGAAAYLECRVVQMIDVGGDHDLLVGEIVGGGVRKEGEVTDTLSLPHVGWSYAG